MMADIGRNRTLLTAAAAIAIVVGLLLVGGTPGAAVPASPSAQEPTIVAAQTGEEPAGEFMVRDYSEYSDKPLADLPSSDWLGLLAGMVVKLAFVLALIYVAILGLRRYVYHGRSAVPGRKPVSVLGLQNLSPGRTVYVLEVGRKVLVVGATQTQLSLLTEVSDPEAIEEMHALHLENPAADQFSSLLNSARRQFRMQDTVPPDSSSVEPLQQKIQEGHDFMQSKLAEVRQCLGQR